jgi:hypothetical protein
MNICTTNFEHELSTILLNESMTESGVISTINRHRKLKHLIPVKPNNAVSVAAKIQANQMASTKQFGHNLKGVKYPKLTDRMKASGYNCYKFGEVLYSGTDDSEAPVRAWLNSPPHREAILHPDVREIGTSVQYSDDGRPYVCAVVCIPNKQNQNDLADIGEKAWDIAKKYGKMAAKKFLVNMAQSDGLRDIANSPIIQKIVAKLR